MVCPTLIRFNLDALRKRKGDDSFRMAALSRLDSAIMNAPKDKGVYLIILSNGRNFGYFYRTTLFKDIYFKDGRFAAQLVRVGSAFDGAINMGLMAEYAHSQIVKTGKQDWVCPYYIISTKGLNHFMLDCAGYARCD